MAIVERSLCEGMKDPTPEFYTQRKYSKVFVQANTFHITYNFINALHIYISYLSLLGE